MLGLVVVLAVAVVSVSGGGRFAYVTVHYEGTSRDAEYVLGIQTLMQSIRLTGTKHDLVVLTSADSVTAKSKALFRAMGCVIIDVDNIPNPFEGKTLTNKGFLYTLNKLHVWNLLQYDRVLYLDADNVLIRNADELFECGDFCAVFMNPCHFHTGLLVVTPDKRVYQNLLASLNHLTSFDGADQGFLSSFYSDTLRQAPLFLGTSKHNSTAMRLPVGYNINHKYFYEQYHWKLYHLRHFAEMTAINSKVPVIVESARIVPALTIGFPMAPLLKPWYWWACFVLDLHWVWHDIRGTFASDYEIFGISSVQESLFKLVFFMSFLSGITFLTTKIPGFNKMRLQIRNSIITDESKKSSGAKGNWIEFISKMILLVLVFFSFWISSKPIHNLIYAPYGFALFLLNQHVCLLSIMLGLSVFRENYLVLSFETVCKWSIWKPLLISLCLEIFIIFVSTCQIFPNIIIKLISIALLGVVCIIWQVLMLYSSGIDPIIESHRVE